MAKGARASSIKKNKTGLKKRVFGPVEIARSERLSAKLLALAQQPKPLRSEMDIEKDDEKAADVEAKGEEHAEGADETMDLDDTSAASKKKEKKGNGFRLERNEKQKAHKASRVTKSSHRRARNDIVFAKSGRARSKKGSSKR